MDIRRRERYPTSTTKIRSEEEPVGPRTSVRDQFVFIFRRKPRARREGEGISSMEAEKPPPDSKDISFRRGKVTTMRER